MDSPRFITGEQAEAVRNEFGTPTYVYSEEGMRSYAAEVLQVQGAFGATARYAMKANPNATILRLFDSMGIHIDASSGLEAKRAIRAGIAPSKILLTSQQLPDNLAELVRAGVQFNACSLGQLRIYGDTFPGTEVSVRINPGEGSGFHAKTNVGGEDSSFGIWHGSLPEVHELVRERGLEVVRVHTHIGSGTDPDVWSSVAGHSAELLHQFPSARTLNLGGGFKVGRMPHEKSVKMSTVDSRLAEVLRGFADQTGREIHLEVEPGTFLMALNGAIVTQVTDVKHTEGRNFIVLGTGMTELLRPSLYGAQHPIHVLSDTDEEEDYIVVGHCCESGDLLTPDPQRPDVPMPRRTKKAKPGDLVVVGGAGAYGAAMSSKNYNSYLEAPEVMLKTDGSFQLMRRRQTMEQMLQNEV